MPFAPSPRRNARPRPRPDFLCIGAQKAGTTWLSANLSAHPQVWTPHRKELHHFDRRAKPDDPASRDLTVKQLRRGIVRLRTEGRTERARHLRTVLRTLEPHSDAWYAALFADAPLDKAAGEYTPRYSTLPPEGVEDVRRSCPGARVIYILRDPAERARSGFRMHLAQSGIGDDEPERLERFARRWLTTPRARRGDYADYIPRWEAHWTPGVDLLYMPFGRIRTDPRGFLAEVERLIDVDPFDAWPRLSDQVNSARKAPLPAWLDAEIEARAKPHRDFVAAHLGEAFAAEMR